MEIKVITNIDSKEFEKIVELGDSNSNTLGFLPRKAFENSAKNGRIIAVFKTNDLFGYLLYRVSFNRITIVHLCVNKEFRGSGIARELVNYLKNKTKQYLGIRLSCRNDYDINGMWERFNFVPMHEKPGRSKQRLPLTVWWYPHNHKNLFTNVMDYELNNKKSVAIDMNVFLDIVEERNHESMALKSDWLINEVNLCVTREIYNEINRAADSYEKERNRIHVSYFNELPFYESGYNEIFEQLTNYIEVKNENDNSDLKHISYTISGGADFFITRDENILNNKQIFEKYGLNVSRPSDFITHFDEYLQNSKYKPQKLHGTNIKVIDLKSDKIKRLISRFLGDHERKTLLQNKVRMLQIEPKSNNLITLEKDNKEIAFVAFKRDNQGELEIPIFRFVHNSLRNTLVKHFLYDVLLHAINENRSVIKISESLLDEELLDIIESMKFVKIDNIWVKNSIYGVHHLSNVIEQINDYPHKHLLYDKSNIEKVDEGNKGEISMYDLERYLYPLKIVELDIPTYIVPIKPYWADALLGNSFNPKLSLNDPDYRLLLNRENVYYRSSKPAILKAPSRILWYVSENRKTQDKGYIVACSYIDAIFIDSAKDLYKRFKELGVYEWKHVDETSNSKNEIMAFVFSDTEEFKVLVSFRRIQTLIKSFENKNFMVVSPFKIKKDTYIEIYKQGMKL